MNRVLSRSDPRETQGGGGVTEVELARHLSIENVNWALISAPGQFTAACSEVEVSGDPDIEQHQT